jgi:hypothetical protein
MSPRNPPSTTDDDGGLDALYRAPLSSFVDVRNALAARLRKAGDAESSSRVKALGKPSVPAWALNQVYWHDRDAYDEMIQAGDRLRALQQQMLAGHGVDSRQAAQARQDAVHTVVDRAVGFLTESGQPPTDATRQRIAITADALATWGSQPRDYAHGRLERELEPPGFAALVSLGPPALRLVTSQGARDAGTASPSPTQKGHGSAARTSSPGAEPTRRGSGPVVATRPVPAHPIAAGSGAAKAEREATRAQQAERTRLARAVQEAEREARARASAHERTTAALERSRAEVGDLAKEVASLERQLATLRARLDRAERGRAEAEASATEAARAHKEATDAAGRARHALDSL